MIDVVKKIKNLFIISIYLSFSLLLTMVMLILFLTAKRPILNILFTLSLVLTICLYLYNLVTVISYQDKIRNIDKLVMYSALLPFVLYSLKVKKILVTAGSDKEKFKYSKNSKQDSFESEKKRIEKGVEGRT